MARGIFEEALEALVRIAGALEGLVDIERAAAIEMSLEDAVVEGDTLATGYVKLKKFPPKEIMLAALKSWGVTRGIPKRVTIKELRNIYEIHYNRVRKFKKAKEEGVSGNPITEAMIEEAEALVAEAEEEKANDDDICSKDTDVIKKPKQEQPHVMILTEEDAIAAGIEVSPSRPRAKALTRAVDHKDKAKAEAVEGLEDLEVPVSREDLIPLLSKVLSNKGTEVARKILDSYNAKILSDLTPEQRISAKAQILEILEGK